MKQTTRLFFKPQQFFNQLQWSTHHWLILVLFLVVTGVESHLGSQTKLYHWIAQSISQQSGLSSDLALWLVVSFKLAVILTFSYLIASAIWLVGNVLGEKNSQRVLFRRLAVVFTVLLSAYTAQHLSEIYSWAGTVSFFLYVWGLLLGYFAIREQFALSHFATMVLGTLAIILSVAGWNGSNRLMVFTAKHIALPTVSSLPTTSTGAEVAAKK